MANPDHIAQLMKGVATWNCWREENPNIDPDLSGADLYEANLVGADLTGADLTGCRIYGVSACRIKLDGAKQQNLIITPRREPEVTVDDIEVALIDLLLHNEKIRYVIDTITSKVVLILGRFTDERKAVLNAFAGRSGSLAAEMMTIR